jgi:transcriptional antiterminator NusG
VSEQPPERDDARDERPEDPSSEADAAVPSSDPEPADAVIEGEAAPAEASPDEQGAPAVPEAPAAEPPTEPVEETAEEPKVEAVAGPPEEAEAAPEEGITQGEGRARAPSEGDAEDSPPEQEIEPAETGTEPAPATAEVSGNGEAAAVAAVPEAEPFTGAGDWYVIHTYAGYENKVKTNLESRINTMQMQDKIFDVVIPMEDVMEIKGGRKQVVQKKVFPGYLLVKMVYDDDSWYVVRNTPGVTGFVSSGTGQKPTPLSRREVEKILAVKKEEVKPTFRLDFEEGDVVRIISGPFADFNGTIDEINVDQSKVKVLVNIFDRETPVELSFDQVARV